MTDAPTPIQIGSRKGGDLYGFLTLPNMSGSGGGVCDSKFCPVLPNKGVLPNTQDGSGAGGGIVYIQARSILNATGNIQADGQNGTPGSRGWGLRGGG